MLRQKQAPVARTPPVLPQIPGITKDLSEIKQEDREHGVIEEKSEEEGSGDKITQQASNNEDSTQNQSFQDENEDEAIDDELDMEL